MHGKIFQRKFSGARKGSKYFGDNRRHHPLSEPFAIIFKKKKNKNNKNNMKHSNATSEIQCFKHEMSVISVPCYPKH